MWNPFKSAKVVDDVFDKDAGLLAKAGEWFGNQEFTDEERAELNLQIAKDVRAFAVATMSENTVRSKTRREISILWIRSQLAFLFMGCIAAPWNMNLAEYYVATATSWLMVSGTTAVLGFFYGTHLHRQHIERKEK